MEHQLLMPWGRSFVELQLQREPTTQRLQYKAERFIALCRCNGFDPKSVDEDLARWLISEWYWAYCEARGQPDPVIEQILAKSRSAAGGREVTPREGAGWAHW